jgi:hypothetical protein
VIREKKVGGTSGLPHEFRHGNLVFPVGPIARAASDSIQHSQYFQISGKKGLATESQRGF